MRMVLRTLLIKYGLTYEIFKPMTKPQQLEHQYLQREEYKQYITLK